MHYFYKQIVGIKKSFFCEFFSIGLKIDYLTYFQIIKASLKNSANLKDFFD